MDSNVTATLSQCLAEEVHNVVKRPLGDRYDARQAHESVYCSLVLRIANGHAVSYECVTIVGTVVQQRVMFGGEDEGLWQVGMRLRADREARKSSVPYASPR